MFVSEFVLTVSFAPWASAVVAAGSEISFTSGIRLSFFFSVFNCLIQRHDCLSVQDAGISDRERCCTELSDHGKEIWDESSYRHLDEPGGIGFPSSLRRQHSFS